VSRGGDWFDLANFDPGPDRAAAGRLFLLDRVDSTSDFLLGRGEGGMGRICRCRGGVWRPGEDALLEPVPTGPRDLAVANVQTRGRGRLDRVWLAGGLQLSWRLPDEAPAPGLPVWLGLAAVQAVRELCGVPAVLKWPNDLFLDGRKLGGMILDLVTCGDAMTLVAGLGVNLTPPGPEAPSAVRDGAISLAEAAPGAADAAAIAGAVLRRCDAGLPRFRALGWEPWRDELAACDHLRGRPVVLRTPAGDLRGVAEGVADDGALRLRRPDGRIDDVVAGDASVAGIGPVPGETEGGSGC